MPSTVISLEITTIILTITAFLTVVGGLLFQTWSKKLIQQKLHTSTLELESQKITINDLKDDIQDKTNENTRLTDSIKLKEELYDSQKEAFEKIQETMKDQFVSLSKDVIKKNMEELNERNTSEIGTILSPLKNDISKFEGTIKKLYDTEGKERFALKREIENIIKVSQEMTHETTNLSNALKGNNKFQGDWGEFILEKALELSGLEKNVQYITQGKNMGLKNDTGKSQKPDFIINLPEDKSIIIDSKVSLTHYERLLRTESSEEKEKLKGEFVQSIKMHAKGLSEKKYHLNEKINTPDFVFLFFPLEHAFGLIVKEAPEVISKAFEQSVVFVSPTTLLSTLKIVHSLWRQEKSFNNSEKIALEAGKLYDKMSIFYDEFCRIGDQINRTKMTYDDCTQKLKFGRGNILSRFDHIKKLGAKNQKNLPTSPEVNQEFI